MTAIVAPEPQFERELARLKRELKSAPTPAERLRILEEMRWIRRILKGIPACW